MTAVDSRQTRVWERHARQWDRVGPPLRPSAEDVDHMLSLAEPALSTEGEAAVVVLGVTPEIVQAPWTGRVALHAVDHSPDMVKALWAPHPRQPSQVHVARWQALPLPDASVRLVVGDNSLGVLPGLARQREVLSELARVLHPQGRLVLRYFARPDQPETLDDVAADAVSGRIGSFHALKWRIAMALSTAPEYSVAVCDVHAAFQQLFPDRRRLSDATGWNADLVATIDAYEGAPTLFTFPTLDAALDAAAPWFEAVEIRRGAYELADRCPIIAYRPRSAEAMR